MTNNDKNLQLDPKCVTILRSLVAGSIYCNTRIYVAPELLAQRCAVNVHDVEVYAEFLQNVGLLQKAGLLESDNYKGEMAKLVGEVGYRVSESGVIVVKSMAQNGVAQ